MPLTRKTTPSQSSTCLFLSRSACPPIQEEWQGASIDIKAAHKRMLIGEEERGAFLSQFENKTYAYRTAHFGAKTNACLERFYVWCISYFISGMLHGSMLRTSYFFFPNQQHTSSSHWQLFFCESLELHYPGRNWNLTPALNGMHGPFNRL